MAARASLSQAVQSSTGESNWHGDATNRDRDAHNTGRVGYFNSQVFTIPVCLPN